MNKRYGILIVSVTILVLCFIGTASATNWSVDGSGGADFTGIQDAINNAKDGDTIIVHSDVYYENVEVDKLVTLKGINLPVVDAGGEGSAITLTADGITLVGFTATYSGSCPNAGIKVTSNNNTITGNNVSNNNYGIFLDDSSNNNTITGNNVSNNNYGIFLDDSSNNKIYLNNLINDAHNAFSSVSTNLWNSTETITYIHNGTTYKSYLGNYWSDYEERYLDAREIDSTGIWNTPYSMDSICNESDESDDYPLMKPFENYILPTSAPA